MSTEMFQLLEGMCKVELRSSPRWGGMGKKKEKKWSKATAALFLTVLYQLLLPLGAFTGKIFQISSRHSPAICLLLLGYRMQHLTLVLLGGNDLSCAAVVLDDTTFSFFIFAYVFAFFLVLFFWKGEKGIMIKYCDVFVCVFCLF